MNQLIKSSYLFVVSLMFFITLGINLDAVAKLKVEIKEPTPNPELKFKDDDDGDAVKVKAKIISCYNEITKATYACYSSGLCPDDAAVEAENSQGTKSMCNLDCDGVRPDINHDCDCPYAIAEDGGLDCVPPL